MESLSETNILGEWRWFEPIRKQE